MTKPFEIGHSLEIEIIKTITDGHVFFKFNVFSLFGFSFK